jgi:hypothetical protein
MTTESRPNGLKPGPVVQTLLREYEDLQKEASQDLTSTEQTWATLPGRTMAKRQAEAKLPEALKAYENAIAKRWGAIVVHGPPALVTEFAKVAADQGPAAVASTSQVYKDLAAEIEPVMRSDRSFEASQFAHLSSAFEQLVKRLGVRGSPMLRYTGNPILADRAALEEHIASLLDTAEAGPVLAAALRETIAKAALEMRYSRNVLPVVVTGTSSTDLPAVVALFGERLVEVTLEKEVTPEVVEGAFKDLKQKYQPANHKQEGKTA